MSKEVVVRKKWDRFRYAVFLEIGLMSIFIPITAFIYDKSLIDVSVLGISVSTMAMIYTMTFNYAYDHFDVRLGNVPTERSMRGRVIHALSFELSFMILTVPFIIWWLQISVWAAITLDIALALSVVVWTFFYTMGYDKLFPVSQQQMELANN